MKRRFAAIALAVMMLLCLLPVTASAADHPLANGDSLDISTLAAGDTVTVAAGASVTITGTKAVRIVCGAGAKVTLFGVTIDNSATDYACPISFSGSGNTLTLAYETTSTLSSGGSAPGVRVEAGTELTIEGPGTLNATGGNNAAGIGGGNGGAAGTITISGGIVKAQGGSGAAGIGSGAGASGALVGGGDITINDTATVTATAGTDAAGIGTGRYGNGGTIEISGTADVTANQLSGEKGTGIGWGKYSTGGSIIISGGTVNATGTTIGAGIGGEADDISITISDGNITAMGGQVGAAIGGAQGYGAGSITITGGTINATAGQGAAIGGGSLGAADGTVSISGGTVIANSVVSGAGIGSGQNSTAAVDITISGTARVMTSTSGGGAGIGSGALASSCDVTIEGGTVNATNSGGAAGIGSGWGSNGGTINISGGTVTATGGFFAIESLAGAGIGGGANYVGSGGAAGDISISGGVVYATGATGADDIGYGSGYTGSSGSFAVSGTAAVFMKNDSCIGPDTSTHSHRMDNSYGITMPGGWTTFGAYLRLYTLSYSTNGGSGTEPDSVTQQAGTTIPAASLGSYTKTGYTLGAKWNAEDDGTGAEYAAGDAFTFDASATLYAKWTAYTYTVEYNENGGTGTTADSSHTYDISKALTSNGFTRTGYTFAGWATSAGGSVLYDDGESVTNLSSTDGDTVTLYAKWTVNTYTVKYDENGGTGTTADSSHTCDEAKALTLNGFTRENYTFAGWAKAAGDAAVYSDGESVTNLSSTDGDTVTLYAKWTAQPTLTSSDADGTIFTGARVTLTPNIAGGTWDFDSAFLSQDGNTFTALKTGTTRITYTVEGQSTDYDVTIQQAVMPSTGQNFAWVWVLCGAALAAFAVAGIFMRRWSAANSR